MGYAHGKLMKEEAPQFINAVWTYLEDQVVCLHLSSDTHLNFTLVSFNAVGAEFVKWACPTMILVASINYLRDIRLKMLN